MAGKVPSRREAKKPPKSKKSKVRLESFSEAPLPSVEEIKPKRKPRAEEESPE
ncbi:MAG TPA: hypothetical protein VFF55_01300 [Candidatus Deferrimicrobium sp.]|jgi:hypothetical protein|nr:hypothetical protein [Candidatus Deferrimicrobium sp.]